MSGMRRPPHLSRMRRPVGLAAMRAGAGQKSFANLNAIRSHHKKKEKDNQMDLMKKKLKQSLEFGSKLAKEKKKMEKQVNFAKMVCTKFEVKLKDLQQELEESTAMNERYAEEVRELKNRTTYQAVETEELDHIKNEFGNLQKENERLSDSNSELRRALKELKDQRETLRNDKSELEEKVNQLGKYEEQYQEERTERIRLMEELEKIKEEKEQAVVASQRRERTVKKLKKKNTKMEDDFNLRLKVIQNNFSISLDNMRMTLVSLKRSFNNERQEIEEEMSEQVEEVIEQIAVQHQQREIEKETMRQVIEEEVVEKKREEFQHLVFKVEQLEEEKKQMEVVIEEVKQNREVFIQKQEEEEKKKPEEPKIIRPPINEDNLVSWLNKFLKPFYHRNGQHVSETVLNRLSNLLPLSRNEEDEENEGLLLQRSVDLFRNGFLFCGILYRFHPSLIDFEVDVEDEESSYSTNCTLAFDLFESKFGVEKTLSPDLGSNPLDAEELPYYLDKVFKSMKSKVDKTKNHFKRKVKGIERDLTRLLTKFSKKRIKKIEELNELVARKKEYLTEWSECQFLFSRLCEFYSSNKTFLEWYKNCHVDNKLFELSTLIIKKRKVMKSGGGGRSHKSSRSGSDEGEGNEEVTKLIEEYNSVCSEYFTWSKQVQEYFLRKDSEEAYAGDEKINSFLADFEDPKLTLQEKQKEIEKNGGLLRKIWKIYHQITGLLGASGGSDKLHFVKEEIERENDIILFSLKGMSTQNIKNIISQKAEL